MKNLIIATGLILSMGFSSGLMAQDKKQSREERKKAKKERIEKQYSATKDMLESKEFVLEANFLGNRYGQRIPVTSNLNFIHVDSSEAVIQVGNQTAVGYNGVGGITTDGRVTDYEMNANDKKNNFTITMNVMTNLGIYDIFMNITADGHASARVNGLSGGQLTYSGKIVPEGQSYVYKGTSTY